MKLKSIEMQGFKSFPDRTVMEFKGGLTCIIGPNGSGKSNISDAVRWVLGEMKMKSLRGSKMEDVIFSGAGDRPPANCASVSLVLDTEEEYLAAQAGITDLIESDGEDDQKRKKAMRISDFREVVITRKYYRSGESEYYINKQQTRLRDIYEMFYDTGIGREGYSVIGQGKISEILSQKADERRSVFEEAAGISRFRVRKEETERKLAEVKNNLERANDILSEVTSQLEPLRKQAEDARVYLTLGEEKRGIELTLWLDKIDNLRQKRTECGEALAAAKLELDGVEARAAALEASLDDLMRRSSDESRMISEAEAEKSDAERYRSQLVSELAVCVREIEHCNSTAELMAQTADNMRSDIADAQALLSGASEALEVLRRERDEAQSASEAARADYEAKEALVLSLTSREAAANDACTKALEALGRIAETVAAVNAEAESIARTAQESEERIARSRERCAMLEADALKAKENSEARRGELSAISQKQSEVETERNECLAEIKKLKETETAERIALTAVEQRREHLRQLEKLLTGYSEGVKTVMGAYSEGKISKKSGKVDIRGLVSTLLSSKGKYVTALETALQSSVQFIVVGDEEDARACIEHLKKYGGGKATFLPLTSVRGRRSDVSGIKSMDGFIGIASDLAVFDPAYAGIADELLGRTVVAEDLEKAAAMARKLKYSVRFVTLDGQMINAGGSYTGGSVSGKTGLFTRAHDLEQLGNDIKERNKRLIELDSRILKLEDRSALLADEMAALEANAEQCRESYDEAGLELSACNTRLDEEKAHLESMIAAVSGGKAGAESVEKRLAQLSSERSAAGESLEAKRQLLAAVRDEMADARAASAKAYELSGAALEAYFAKLNAYDAQNRSAESLKERISNSEARMAEALSSKADSLSLAESKRADADALEAKVAEASANAEQAGKRMSALLASRETIEAETTSVRTELRTVQSERDEAFRNHSLHETTCTRIEEEIELISAKMWDGYELTYTTALQFRLADDLMKNAQSRLNALNKRIRSMGTINLGAVEQYAAVKEKYDYYTNHIGDLEKARRGLDSAISKLSTEMKDTFVATLQKINTTFDEVFRRLFGGGGACVELEDPENPLESGIDITLRIPGKKVRSITLLSGGEQSFAAVALYLSLQKINPSPFCVFDEIESALDDVNLCKLADYVKEESEKTQYIMITHRRGTMERADTLYGITMQQKGISTYLKLDLAKMDENIRRYV